MNTKTIRARNASGGFTIVELLIVIIVIGILAGIVLVSYNGTVTSSKTNAAQASASALQHKIEGYGSVKGSFPYPSPLTAANYTSLLNSLPDSSISNTNIAIGTPGPSNGQYTVQVQVCTTPAVVTTGAYIISYYDFAARTLSSKTITGSLATTACSNWQTLS